MTKLPLQAGPKPMSPLVLSPTTATKLIKSYCDRGLLANARQLFDEMPKRDTVAWTALISGHTSNGDHGGAWTVFQNMLGANMAPNAFTVSNVLKACKGMDWHCGGAMVHSQAIRLGIDRQSYVENSLLDVYASCGCSMRDAHLVFDEIEEKSVVSWTTMITGYTRRGYGDAGIRLFHQMIQEGFELNPFTFSIVIRACASIRSFMLGKQVHGSTVKSGNDKNIVVANSLLDMYSRCLNISEAKMFFSEMPQKNLITWNSMISGLEQCLPQEALQLLIDMAYKDIDPDCFTYTSIASACASLAALNCAQQVHGAIIQRGFGGNLEMGNALVDMYAKCGSIADSQKVFSEMPYRSLISWTSMMVGYGIHGYGKEVVELFHKMIDTGIKPDSVVFMSVISACSHAGLVEDGLKYFNLMRANYNVLPDKEVYGCVIDLLGRAGRLQEAYELIEKIPFAPSELIWGALLGACKMHKNTALGRVAAEKILDLKPEGAKTYVILSDIYASCSEWDEFAEVRRLMKGVGSKKEAGRSWIEVRDGIYSFVVGDRINKDTRMIHDALQTLAQHMKKDSVIEFPFDGFQDNLEAIGLHTT